MANRRNTFAKSTRANLKLAGVTAAVLFASADLSALGLGALDVKSNLDQPLRGVIELRTNTGDDLDSVKASIASRADFENLGIDYPTYLNNLSLSVDQLGDTTVLRVDSADVIIKEPFIHFLVRVDWSGGSFLREYTALIDPPVYAADTPKPLAQPKLVGTDQSYQPEVMDSDESDSVDESEVVAAELADPDQVSNEPTTYTDDADTPAEEYYEPEAVADVANEQSVATQATAEVAQQPTDAQYGPVTKGESLSMIAQELQRQFPDLSIYQIMQVMFEENKSSFIDGNINGLIKGSILNIGDLNVIRAVDVEQSKVFFRTQLAEWDPSLLEGSDSDSLKVGQDEYNVDSDANNTSSDPSYASGETPASDSFQVGASAASTFVSNGSGDSGGGEVIALRGQISELQTSLASSSIENRELTERISMLEGQLADMNSLMNMTVEDADLANLEASLAKQNSVKTQSLGDSSANDLGASSDQPAVDADYVDSLQAGAEAGTTNLQSDLSDDGLALGQSTTSATGSTETDVAVVDESTVVKPKIVPVKAELSILEKAKAAIFADGLWPIMGGVGALLIGVLVLLVMRRRRADEEFEISMLSIGANSQSVGDDDEASGSMSTSETRTVLRNNGGDKETSFLTVYSDSDAVIQADEVDPIAEADVYIAYGRDEQAEEVLLDGVASNPDRLDIKHKLLGLYHKNKNPEGYERVAEELYSQRDALPAAVWKDVCSMGKDLSSNNPLFDLSPEDLAAAGFADSGAPMSKQSVSISELSEPEVPKPADPEPEVPQPQVAEPSVDASGDHVDEAESNSGALGVDTKPESVMAQQGLGLVELSENIESNANNQGLSELVGDALDGGGDESIQLINFDDGRSEISELDDVEIDALELDDDDASVQAANIDSDRDSASEKIEVDLDDDLEIESIEFGTSPTSVESVAIDTDTDESGADSLETVTGLEAVSGLEIDGDYDDARTQYELAKVFVDLGDEDGARKILQDIVNNDDNSPQVRADANELLESIA